MLKSFNNGCALLKFISINIIADISWPPPLISQHFFHPGFLRPYYFFTALLFLCGFYYVLNLESLLKDTLQ